MLRPPSVTPPATSTMEIAVESFKVHNYDANVFGTLTAQRLLGYLLEAAGTSADCLGFGIRDLQRRGLTWVLGRIQIVLDEEIVVGDEVEVETWPSGLDRAVAMRDFRIKRNGRSVGRSTSRWFVLDMESRLAVRPHDVFPERLRPQLDHQLRLTKTVPSLPGPASLTQRFEVRRADIDLNRHVTAASYISWAMEAVPVEILDGHWLSCYDVQFLDECHLGDTIVSESHLGPNNAAYLRISRASDAKDLARFVTAWTERGSIANEPEP